jgi:hypothetical protein
MARTLSQGARENGGREKPAMRTLSDVAARAAGALSPRNVRSLTRRANTRKLDIKNRVFEISDIRTQCLLHLSRAAS